MRFEVERATSSHPMGRRTREYEAADHFEAVKAMARQYRDPRRITRKGNADGWRVYLSRTASGLLVTFRVRPLANPYPQRSAPASSRRRQLPQPQPVGKLL